MKKFVVVLFAIYLMANLTSCRDCVDENDIPIQTSPFLPDADFTVNPSITDNPFETLPGFWGEVVFPDVSIDGNEYED